MDNQKPGSNHLQHSLSELHNGGAVAGAGSRLEALAVDFEAEHPSLAASLREFVALLGRAGL
jgi:hypothetical protein